MSTEQIDQALTELVDLRWNWLHSGKPSEMGKQVEEKAGKLAAEVPQEYQEFVGSIQNEVRSTPAMSAMSFGPETVVAEATSPAAVTSDSSVEDLMAALFELEGEATESQLARLTALAEKDSATAKESMMKGAGQLPVRNAGSTTAKHVQLFTQSNGLVHGGVISIGSSRLVCRAFRFYRSGNNHNLDVVAGVCEQMDASGKVVQRWTTAERLTDMYQNTSQPLPAYACRYDGGSTTGWMGFAGGQTEGFYHGERFATELMNAIRALTKPNLLRPRATKGGLPFEVPDTGPHRDYYLKTSFSTPPGPDTAVENALYDKLPTASAGYVINTPYLSVFSPSPLLPIVIVSMVGVYREAWMNASQSVTRFERKAGWTVRSFTMR